MARQRDARAVRLRGRKRALRPIASILDLTAVRCDQRGGPLRDRLISLAAELRADIEQIARVTRRQLPVSRAPLEQAQQPECIVLLRVLLGVQGFAPLF